ncbi:MAG: endonuclease III [Nitrospiraceae bacterium]
MAQILKALAKASPSARVELTHATALELLIATILSAQSTDQRVNLVTRRLFRRYRTVCDYASANPREVEEFIRSTGFFKSKARSIIGCTRALIEKFDGEVPDSMDELVTLPGVGRKTANVVLGNWFGQPAIVVDTHVKRVSHRLGLAASDNPDQIELSLQRLIPRRFWTAGSQRLLLHGRYLCLARKPKCDVCPIYAQCRWEGKRPR